MQKSEDEKYGAFQQLQALGFRIAVEWVWFRKVCAAALSPRGFQTHSKGNEEALKRYFINNKNHLYILDTLFTLCQVLHHLT